jgi:hypothetical protein
VTSRKLSAKAKKRPPKPGQDRRRKAPVIEANCFEQITTADTLRMPAEIHNALICASFERKMQRQDPWTQQEIAADALAAWLRKQSFL